MPAKEQAQAVLKGRQSKRHFYSAADPGSGECNNEFSFLKAYSETEWDIWSRQGEEKYADLAFKNLLKTILSEKCRL